ncbi:ADP-ribosyltransferase [Mycolicibacterium porcinum]|uniref:ADP-ribosyltransferase n=1 Tax=Mycolicibacterium porcinum TaxID=39693 RepID=A0ABV3VI64_9MYCO
MGGYEVDPQQLAASGKTVGAQGDALIGALNTLDSALVGSGLMCGTDAAGLQFFSDYRKSGQAVISAAESAVNAFRNVGYGVEVSARNYAVSDAASTVGGGRESIPVPAEPTKYTASGVAGQAGPEIPEPSLWSLVQPFVSQAWPNGNPDTMLAVAGAWRSLGTAISTAAGDAGSCLSSVSGHDIPELTHITGALNTLTDSTNTLAGKCSSLAEKLDSFAGEVQSAQDAIRDLLHRLSVSGIVSQIGRIFTGHNPIDDLKQIGHDISEILHTLSGELDTAASGFQILIDGMDGLVRKFEEWDRKEFTRFFGNDVGNALAGYVNAHTQIAEGVVKSGLEVGQSVPTMLAHPVETAKGIWEIDKNLAEFFNPVGVVLDPAGHKEAGDHLLETVKGVVDYKDWSSDRPLVGLGDNLGNIAQVLMPGVGEAKAGVTAGRAGEEGAQVARAEGAAARSGVEAFGKTGVDEIAGQAGKIGKDLDGLSAEPIETPKAPEPVGRPADSGPVPSSHSGDGAAAANNGAGKAPVDVGARPGGDIAPVPHAGASSPHGGEPPVGGHGAPAANGHNGSGSHTSPPVHVPAESTPVGSAAHSGVAQGEGSVSGVAGTGTHQASGFPHSQPNAAGHDTSTTHGHPSGTSDHDAPHNGEAPHSGDGQNGNGPNDKPNNPPHTGLHDPPLNQGIPGENLPDLDELNKEYRLPSGEVDPDRLGEWAEKVADEYPSLSKNGVEGLYDYTTENYDGMNPYLRDTDPLTPAQQQVLDAESIDRMTDAQRVAWEEKITSTDEGLSGLPPYRADPDDPFSTTWRGMRASDSLLDQFVEGSIFSDPAYLSSSTDAHVAEIFARGAAEDQTPTLLKIEGYDGVEVRQVSRYVHESEILFPRGAEFEVISKQLGEDGIWRVVLKQVLR